MQTQSDQDRDLEDARSYLSVTTVTVDRCRHESVTETSLWFFADGQQIASATRLEDARRWRVSLIRHGMPTTCHNLDTLLGAVGYVMRGTR